MATTASSPCSGASAPAPSLATVWRPQGGPAYGRLESLAVDQGLPWALRLALPCAPSPPRGNAGPATRRACAHRAGRSPGGRLPGPHARPTACPRPRRARRPSSRAHRAGYSFSRTPSASLPPVRAARPPGHPRAKPAPSHGRRPSFSTPLTSSTELGRCTPTQPRRSHPPPAAASTLGGVAPPAPGAASSDPAAALRPLGKVRGSPGRLLRPSPIIAGHQFCRCR
jgi:hypothetical protein